MERCRRAANSTAASAPPSLCLSLGAAQQVAGPQFKFTLLEPSIFCPLSFCPFSTR